jgi:hypothetical protein
MTGLLAPVRSEIDRRRNRSAGWSPAAPGQRVGRRGGAGDDPAAHADTTPSERVVYVNCRPRRRREESLMDAVIRRYLDHEPLRPEQARACRLSVLV